MKKKLHLLSSAILLCFVILSAFGCSDFISTQPQDQELWCGNIEEKTYSNSFAIFIVETKKQDVRFEWYYSYKKTGDYQKLIDTKKNETQKVIIDGLEVGGVNMGRLLISAKGITSLKDAPNYSQNLDKTSVAFIYLKCKIINNKHTYETQQAKLTLYCKEDKLG